MFTTFHTKPAYLGIPLDEAPVHGEPPLAEALISAHHFHGRQAGEGVHGLLYVIKVDTEVSSQIGEASCSLQDVPHKPGIIAIKNLLNSFIFIPLADAPSLG